MRRILFLLPILLLTLRLTAHPHMFIDTQMKIDIDQTRLEGLEITWYFDPLFTASIVGDFDEDKNGRFDPKETEEIREYAFSNLANFDYFTFVMTGGGTYTPQSIEDFEAFMEGGQLVYRFYAPFGIDIAGTEAAVAIYDESFFCDILYHEQSPVAIRGSNADWEIVENKDLAINYGGSVSVSRDGADYSGTAFPQQIVISIP